MFRTLSFALLALVGLAGSLWLWTAQRPASPLAEYGMANAQTADVDTSQVTEMTMGAEDAPLTVTEYASFTCPHCEHFHDTVWPDLKREYIDTGKVKFVYREVYFDKFGLWAGMVARCGGEDSYFGFVDALYDTQKQWIGDGKDAAVADNLRRLGRTAGLSDDEVNACLNDNDKARALVATFQKNAEADGVNSTPSFVIDGKTYQNMPWEEFKAILDEKLPG